MQSGKSSLFEGGKETTMVGKEQIIKKQEAAAVAEAEAGSRAMTPETMISGLKQLAAMNNVFVTVLESTSSPDPIASEFNRRQFLAVFADAATLTQKEVIKDHLHKAAHVRKDMVYCPCRICCLTPKGEEDLLKRYAEASRAIRETATVRDLFRTEGYPLPQYLSVKTVAALCHFREKLSEKDLPQDTRRKYGECLRRLVQEAQCREESGK